MRFVVLLLCAVAAVRSQDAIFVTTSNGDNTETLWYGKAGNNANLVNWGKLYGEYEPEIFGNGQTVIFFILACVNTTSTCGIYTADLTQTTPTLWQAASLVATNWQRFDSSTHLLIVEGRLLVQDSNGTIYISDSCVLNSATTGFTMLINPSGIYNNSIPLNFDAVDSYSLTPHLSLFVVGSAWYLGSLSTTPIMVSSSNDLLNHYANNGLDSSGNYYVYNNGGLTMYQPISVLAATQLNCSNFLTSTLFTSVLVANSTWNTTADPLQATVTYGTTLYVITAGGAIWTYTPGGNLTRLIQSGPSCTSSQRAYATADGSQLFYYTTVPRCSRTSFCNNNVAGSIVVYNTTTWAQSTHTYNTSGFYGVNFHSDGIYYITNAGNVLFQPFNAAFNSSNIVATGFGSVSSITDAQVVIPSNAYGAAYDFKHKIISTCDGLDYCNLPQPAALPPVTPAPSSTPTSATGAVVFTFTLTGTNQSVATQLLGSLQNSSTEVNNTVTALVAAIKSYVQTALGTTTVTIYACSITLTDANGVPTSIPLTTTLYSGYVSTQCPSHAIHRWTTQTAQTPTFAITITISASAIPVGTNANTALQTSSTTAVATAASNAITTASGVTITATASVQSTVTQLASPSPSPPPPPPPSTPAAPSKSSSSRVHFIFATFVALLLFSILGHF